MRFVPLLSTALTSALLLTMPGSANAEHATGLTGNWGGIRNELAERGVTVAAGYTSEAAGNLRGGQRHSTAHAGQFAIASTIDLAQLWGWNGLRASASLSVRDGDDLNTRAGLGELLQNQEIYGRGHLTRLGDLWLGWHSAAAGLDLKAGRLSPGNDFNRLDCDASHLAFCGTQPAIFGGDYWYNSPLSQWGVVVAFAPAAPWYLRVGAYQVNPRYTHERSGGLRLAPAGTVGTLTPLELGWEPRVRGLQGRYALGGWYSSAPRIDADPLQGRDPASAMQGVTTVMRSGAYGGWFSAQQQLTHGASGDESSGLRVQFAYAQGDTHGGQIDRMVNLIGTWTGLAAARPEDQVGLGLGVTHVNPRAARFQQAIGATAAANDEVVAEVFYRWQALPSIALQPSLQFVHRPGGVSAAADIVVVGLRTSLLF